MSFQKKNKVNRKYRIVYIIDGLGMGGAERLMIPILKNLSREHFEVRVCALQVRDGNPMAEQIRAMGIPVDLLIIPYLRDLTALPRLIKYLRKIGADLVHAQLEFSDIFGNIAAKALRLPSVSTLHTMPSQDMQMKLKLHQKLEFLALRCFCDVVISVSDVAREFYLNISSLHPSTLRTLYNGIDLPQIADQNPVDARATVRKELGIPADASVLTTVAVLRELKGIQFMIQALPAILTRFPKSYYLIVGHGDYLESLIRQVELAGVKEHVIFAGQRNDVQRFLRASDIFVLPTLTEALPTVLAEAMTARLPIVASSVGGIPEMVVDGQNGRLVPSADPQALSDACLDLLSKPQECAQMGEKGWEVVNQKFNIRTQVAHLEKLYLDLIHAYE
jgi:glycosyltransferase involved in cell wall biosynthesis